MKFILMVIMVLGTSMTFASEVRDFNKILIEDVQNDLNTDNDQAFKNDNAPLRGPASVEAEEAVIQEESKIEKQERKLGNSRW